MDMTNQWWQICGWDHLSLLERANERCILNSWKKNSQRIWLLKNWKYLV
jgi:hypothetical protein